MKYLILSLLLLFGCNNQNSYDCAKDGDACHVQSKGDPGQEGAQGVTGSPGAVGETGQDGLAGADGLSGTNGNRWYSGYINPSDTFGNDFDFYLNLTTGDIYNKVDSTWGSPVANIMGPQGTQGIVGPSGSDGVDGLNGADGSNGTDGTAGIDGVNGLDGAKGDVGDIGPQGAAGATGAAGVDGQSAILSSGPVGPRVTGKSYSACHHDYLYLSNGWLLFRHQANGTADQGAGTTGFEVWDVDISDFLLISEVGNITYCTLHYDENTLKLTGTVNDNSDGFAGTQINIDL